MGRAEFPVQNFFGKTAPVDMWAPLVRVSETHTTSLNMRYSISPPF